MARVETPEVVARTRMVTVEGVLENRVDLRGYPYRNLAIISTLGHGPERVTRAMAALEHLEQFGWELVSVAEFGTTRIVYLFLRRKA